MKYYIYNTKIGMFYKYKKLISIGSLNGPIYMDSYTTIKEDASFQNIESANYVFNSINENSKNNCKIINDEEVLIMDII